MMELESPRRVVLHNLLDVMKEIVFDEIASHGAISRVDLSDNLGLKMQSYPLESATQASTTWLTSILIRRLQDEGRIFYKMDSSRVFYSTKSF